MSFFWLFLTLAMLAPSGVLAWTGRVVAVTDGDTVKVLHRGREEKVRLYGVDTPEKAQPYGMKARQFTALLAAGKTVQVQTLDQDGYGRSVALVYVDKRNLNREIVAAGFGWVYLDYCRQPFCLEWLGLEAEARRQRRGLWQGRQPVPPWDWRRRQRRQPAAVFLPYLRRIF